MVDSDLERQVYVQADRERARVARAAVGGLHDPRAAAGDDREAGLAERAGGLARELVLGVVARRACRAEDRHRGTDARERSEALGQLAAHALYARGVGLRRDDRLDLCTKQLLVECRRRTRLAPLVGHELILVR